MLQWTDVYVGDVTHGPPFLYFQFFLPFSKTLASQAMDNILTILVQTIILEICHNSCLNWNMALRYVFTTYPIVHVLYVFIYILWPMLAPINLTIIDTVYWLCEKKIWIVLDNYYLNINV